VELLLGRHGRREHLAQVLYVELVGDEAKHRGPKMRVATFAAVASFSRNARRRGRVCERVFSEGGWGDEEHRE
jgi:hypothetical protein